MRGNGPSDADVICTRVNRFAWSHEPLLIARFCPTWPNSLHSDSDSVTELATQGFDFMRTGDEPVDARCYAQLREAYYLRLDRVCDPNFAKRLFSGAG